jgi:signal transduction histidine kinase
MESGAGDVQDHGGGAAPDGDLHTRIESERAAALYGKGVSPYLANVLIGAIEIVAVAGVVPPARRYGWLALMSVVTLMRLVLWELHRRHPGRLLPRQWCIAFAIGGTANGLTWGATAFFLWGPGAGHHALLGFVVGGMVAGATAVVPAYLPAFYTFALAALAPVATRLLVAGSRVDVTMGVLLLVFGLNMTKLARGAGRWFFQNTELKLHNARLVEYLSEARDDLELRVTERTGELVKTVAQLREAELRAQDAVRVRNDFLAVASHELRTPLATLELQVGRLEWHLSQPRAVDRSELGDSVKALRRQVRRLTGLVDTVLTASGLARQGMVLEKVELDLGAVVRAVVADASASPAARGTPVTLALEERVMGRWDPVRVEQVVANLVSNALKYGVGKPVRIGLTTAGNDALLEIEDHGPGIAPAHRERIFERFFRADVGGQTGGLGLGLAVVRELVEAMNGAITVDSQSGRGTIFTVRLPRR